MGFGKDVLMIGFLFGGFEGFRVLKGDFKRFWRMIRSFRIFYELVNCFIVCWKV
jgi:hypothetical protein